MLTHAETKPGKTQPRLGSRWYKWGRWGLVAFVGVAVVLILGMVLIYRSEWILPGIQTLGVELGGRSRVEAAAALQGDWQQRTILLDAGDMVWTVVPSTLGLTLDVEATVEAAYQSGRSVRGIGALLRGNAQTGLGRRLHTDVLYPLPPVLEVDPLVAEANLRALRAEIDVPAVNSGVRLAGGRVEAISPEPGRAFDLAATVAWLEGHAVDVATEGRLKLAVLPVPPLVSDVSALVARANEWLAHTLSVLAYDPITDETLAWAVAPDVWGAWVSLTVDSQDATKLDWQFDAQAAQAWVSGQAMSLGPDRYLDSDEAIAAIREAIAGGRGPSGRPTSVWAASGGSWQARLRVYHRGRQHIVQTGETLSSIARDVGIPYPWIQQANPGVEDALHVGQVLTLPSPDVLLALPVVEDKRIVVSLSQQKMWAYEKGDRGRGLLLPRRSLLWEWPVSTGIPSSPTSPGVFQIQSHEPNAYAASWDLWMPYFMGIYRPVPTSDFMNGFHGFPTRDGANLLWTANLGHPVTYGCILISTQNAALLYEWAEKGVIVEIQR